MYIEFSDNLVEQIKEISSGYEFKGNMLEASDIKNLIFDLFVELDVAEEKNLALEDKVEELQKELNEYIEEKNEDIEKNPYLYYGISESDFH